MKALYRIILSFFIFCGCNVILSGGRVNQSPEKKRKRLEEDTNSITDIREESIPKDLILNTKIANDNWECVDCFDDNTAKVIFGILHRAIQYESHEVYLNFDYSQWIKRVLRQEQKVIVRNIPRDKLASTVIEFHDDDVPDTALDEVFYAVVSLPLQIKFWNESPEPLPVEEAVVIDEFLKHNPCWVVFKDPPVVLYSPKDSKTQTTSDFGGNSAPKEASDTQLQYDFSSVFIRLPVFPHRPTCQLYQYIYSKQFPSECPSLKSTATRPEDSSVITYWLGNIGWANCLHPLVEHLRSAMQNGKVLITPRACENGAYPDDPIIPVPPQPGQKQQDQQFVVATGNWGAWAQLEECPVETFGLDPWACHFISLSKCNNIELHNATFEQNILPNPKTATEYTTFVEKLDVLRSVEHYGDGAHLKIYDWEMSRMIAYAQRPNIFLRARLRRSLLNLSELGRRVHVEGSIHNNNHFLRLHNADQVDSVDTSGWSYSSGENSPRYHEAAHMKPCLAMHVRHGDSQNDQRGQMNLDRSIGAHVGCARNIMVPMGLENIFLATDDVDLLETVATAYPQYKWFTLQRALKKFNGSSFDYRHESTAQSEIANMIGDMILFSRCSAGVGSIDGGFFRLLLQMACTKNNGDTQRCMPVFDIRYCQVHKTLY